MFLSQPLRTEHQLETELQSLIWLEPMTDFFIIIIFMSACMSWQDITIENSTDTWQKSNTVAVTLDSLLYHILIKNDLYRSYTNYYK